MSFAGQAVPARTGPRRRAPTGGAGTAALVVVPMAAYLIALAWCMENTSYDVWGAVVLAPLLLAVSLPVAVRLARREPDPALVRIVVWALVLKLAGAVARYATAYAVYDGFSDADEYHKAGRELAEFFRRGDFDVQVQNFVGTGFVKVLTGLVYAVIGPTSIGGFLVFSLAGFWGLFLFYRAFCIAVPGGDRRRYALLVFFLPSLIFWPSSIGKEAWMTLTLGLSAYAGARLLAGRRGAFLLLALGLTGTAMVRPHMALIAFASIAVAFLVRRDPSPSPFKAFRRGLALVVLVGFSVVVLGQVQEFFGVSKLDAQGVNQVLDNTVGRTTQGNSTFEAPRASSPAQVPGAVVSVMFRPFLYEARNPQSGLAALEGALLFVLFVGARRRIFAAYRRVRSNPYVVMALVWILLFAFAFSSFSNFGIIVRQRVQMLPLALALLALAPPPRSEPSARPAATGMRRPGKVGATA